MKTPLQRRFTHLSLWAFALAVLLTTGCAGDDESVDGSVADASFDGGVPDGSLDGGSSDGGETDAGSDGGVGMDVPLNLADPVEIDVSDVFAAGTEVRDGYTGQTGTVDADGNLSIRPHVNGVVLLEDAQTGASEFDWENVTVYFIVTDRFENGDTSNDTAYGRQPDGAGEISTFHGGDWKGITDRLDYIADLGATAIWITPIVEQIGGWVPTGRTPVVQGYPYMGYWAKDFTKLDESWGTEADFEAMVEAAHQRGIRVVVDVVLNHPGYASPADIAEIMPSIIDPNWESWTPGAGETLYDIYSLIDFEAVVWDTAWWGPDWVRACLGDTYSCPPNAASDTEKGSVGSLPDFATEDFRAVDLPPILANKSDTNAVSLGANKTVRDYLVTWQSDWVRRFGIDGFRADTAKHVEKASWAALKDAAAAALADWRSENPNDPIGQDDFWMTAEVFPPPSGLNAPAGSPEREAFDAFFSEGKFDSVINFDFQNRISGNPGLLDDVAAIDGIYSNYAAQINGDPNLQSLTYISSHDKSLFFEDTNRSIDRQFQVGTVLMMMPGGVQVFYGDETARPAGEDAGDETLGTRSDMNWDSINPELLAHWQRLGQFRKKHRAVGAGTHRRIARDLGYAFAREDGADEVMVVVLDPSEIN